MGIQRVIVDAIQGRAWKELRDEARALAWRGEHGKTTAIHILTATSKSQMGRLFAVDLSDRHCDVPAGVFVAYTRFWLGLPQLLMVSESTMIEGGYEAGLCNHPMHDDDEDARALDAGGNHAAWCRTIASAKNATHNRISKVILMMAREAGLETRSEPTAASCLNMGISPEEAAVWFPDKSTR